MDGNARVRSWVTAWGRTYGLPGPDAAHAYFPRYDEDEGRAVRDHCHELVQGVARAGVSPDPYPWRVRWVRVAAVRGIQNRVQRAKVAALARVLRRPKHGVPLPFVIEVGGVPYVWNGHHRFVALMVLGRTRARCWVRVLPPLAAEGAGM